MFFSQQFKFVYSSPINILEIFFFWNIFYGFINFQILMIGKFSNGRNDYDKKILFKIFFHDNYDLNKKIFFQLS